MENPWHRLPQSPPFVLPEDEVVVRAFNKGAREKYRLRVNDLLPEPFVGGLDASVVLLSNNPGFTPEGAARKKEARFRARMRSNLDHGPSDYPFVFFAPDIDDGHKTWWNRKLKGLLHFGYAKLAASILVVEHFPYASQRYSRKRLDLPSQAQDYNFQLVQQAIEQQKLIVLMRGRHRWFRDVQKLCKYDRLCTLRNPQAGSISAGNCERFEEIAQAIAAHAGRPEDSG